MVWNVSELFLFYGWIISHFVYKPHFVYLFICWWTLGLFPPFGCWGKCGNEHWCTSLCLSPYFCFFGVYLEVNLPGHMVIVCLTFWETATLLFLSFMAICSVYIKFLSTYSWLTILYYFQAHSIVIQEFSRLYSIKSYCKVMTTFRWAVQCILVVFCIHRCLHLLTPYP